jgi:hypothetical protein
MRRHTPWVRRVTPAVLAVFLAAGVLPRAIRFSHHHDDADHPHAHGWGEDVHDHDHDAHPHHHDDADHPHAHPDEHDRVEGDVALAPAEPRTPLHAHWQAPFQAAAASAPPDRIEGPQVADAIASAPPPAPWRPASAATARGPPLPTVG